MKEVRAFDDAYFGEVTNLARTNERRRQHQNVHRRFGDPCQKLFNALCSDTYIRPHRHNLGNKTECLIAVRGQFALVIFDDAGNCRDVIHFGTEASGYTVGVELDPAVWHMVIALTLGAVLFEVKDGPFKPEQAKELAPWAPVDGTPEATVYLETIRATVKRYVSQIEPNSTP